MLFRSSPEVFDDNPSVERVAAIAVMPKGSLIGVG